MISTVVHHWLFWGMTCFYNWFYNVFAKSFGQGVLPLLFASIVFWVGKETHDTAKRIWFTTSFARCNLRLLQFQWCKWGGRFKRLDGAVYVCLISRLMCYQDSCCKFSEMTEMSHLSDDVTFSMLVWNVQREAEISSRNACRPARRARSWRVFCSCAVEGLRMWRTAEADLQRTRKKKNRTISQGHTEPLTQSLACQGKHLSPCTTFECSSVHVSFGPRQASLTLKGILKTNVTLPVCGYIC